MAYVILTANGDEVDRRELTAAMTIGRAQDADVPVRDILLSRKHCRIEQSGESWVVVDLGSKNGTYLGSRVIARHTLRDGDELRLGRTRMTFRLGSFEPAPAGTRRRDVVRPADPNEALAGTVAGFLLVEPGEVERQAGAPVPRPRPPEPTSYASEDVYGMLNEIASSSWDSIMAQASRPLVMERPLPRPDAYRGAARVVSRPRVAFCLQAPVTEGANATTAATNASLSECRASAPSSGQSPTGMRLHGRRGNIRHRLPRQLAIGAVSIALTALLVGAWLVAVNHGPPQSRGAAPPVQRTSTPALSRELIDITFPATEPDVKLPAQTPTQDPVQTPAASISPLRPHLSVAVTLQNALRVAALPLLVAH